MGSATPQDTSGSALHEAADAGSLYTIEKDLTCIKKVEGVTISNGMAWSSENTTFYYIDTPTFEVVAYNYDIKSGDISNRRVVIAIPKKEGFHDGMSIDREGMLWIAHLAVMVCMTCTSPLPALD
jgi:sugar lactone lactonase YvrE